MYKISRICVLTFLIISISVTTYSQVDTTIILSDLIISGNRISIPFSEASRNVQIITNDQIKKEPVQSIPEILTYVPGVDIRQRGPVGVQADIGIRGGTFEQTLILLNGIKLTDPQTGHHIMNIPVPLDNVQQIEVLKGPGARIYGQNAFAGAVNLITQAPETRKFGIRGYGGDFGSYGGSINVSLPIGVYKQYVSFSRDASDGYRHNTDYGINNIFYQSDVSSGNGICELIVGLTDRKFGANGFYASPAYTEQYEEVKTSITSISYETKGSNYKLKPRIYWRWNRDKYLFIRDNPGAYQNLHETNTLGMELNSSYTSVVGVTGFGIEFRKENINGNWLRGGTESKSNLDGFKRDNFGIYVDHKFKIYSKFDINPGIYVNWYSDFGWNTFPGIDVGYTINDRIRLYANVGKSFRIPTFYDQYYVSPIELGNPDLMPEEAITYDAGLRYLKSGISLETNLFIRDASQIIDWVYNPLDSISRAQNFSDITTRGLELALNLNFLKLIDTNFPIYNMSLSYNYLDQNLEKGENIQSRYVLEHIRNQVIFGVEHRLIGRLTNSLKIRYIDRFEQNPYLLADDRLFFRYNEHFKLFLEATNLMDQKYSEVMTTMPGRWIRAGLNLDIGF